MISATESIKVTDNNYNNLDLYIPRISALTTEEKIKQLFWQLYIGHVEYADIVATKHPDRKELQYFSAFVKLKYWGPILSVGDIFQNTKTYKMELKGFGSDLGERFWLLLPNKTPLPRTKVNVSQLAASTDKLFEQQEAMAAEIKELKELTVSQSAIIESLQFKRSAMSVDCEYIVSLLSGLENKQSSSSEMRRSSDSTTDFVLLNAGGAANPVVMVRLNAGGGVIGLNSSQIFTVLVNGGGGGT